MILKRFALVFTTVALIVSSAFGISMYKKQTDYKNYLQGEYQKNMYDLISDVDNIQNSLSKLSVSSDKLNVSVLLGEVWQHSAEAQQELSALPVSQNISQSVSRFLSQTGDFSYTLMKDSNDGKKFTKSVKGNIKKLTDYAAYLSAVLHSSENEVSSGNIDWDKIREESALASVGNLSAKGSFMNVSQENQEYPTLIYDGPFSENVLSIKPKVTLEPKLGIDRAREAVHKAFPGKNIKTIGFYSEKGGETIPSYSLSVNFNGGKDTDASIDISKNGGRIVYMLYPRDINKASLSMKDAVKRGNIYLKSIGYNNMIPTYNLRYDNTAVVNYVYVDNKYVIYPDQIKLKIALDNGEVVGIEAAHYLTAHAARKFPQKIISLAQARKMVSSAMTVKNIRKAIIPMESKREVYCYEFFGANGSDRFFAYINAISGKEERILKVVPSENGDLTM